MSSPFLVESSPVPSLKFLDSAKRCISAPMKATPLAGIGNFAGFGADLVTPLTGQLATVLPAALATPGTLIKRQALGALPLLAATAAPGATSVLPILAATSGLGGVNNAAVPLIAASTLPGTAGVAPLLALNGGLGL
ncbi:hypothetical protein G9A89_009204 [Geosiphon pyriformis]|nr:hypothetical protein G9A89_009204 [Geosiphon pyriformis]